MKFLRDLIAWFFHGKDNSAPVEDFPIPPLAEAPKEKEEKEEVEFDIISGTKPMGFLAELRAIRPAAQEFNRAREELIEELRKLAPKKRVSERSDRR